MSKLIVGFGEALVDILPGGEFIGGAPLNFSVRAAELGARLGVTAAMVTRVGDDLRGQRICDRLRAANVDCSAVQMDPTLSTGTVDVRIVAGQPAYAITENVAWDAIGFDSAVQLLACRSNAICFGTLALRSRLAAATLRRMLEHAPNAIKVVDLNLRFPLPTMETVRWSLHQADVLKCNSEELQTLGQWFSAVPGNSEREIAMHLQSQFRLRAIFWTRGEHGCCWQTGNEIIEGPIPKIEPAHDADSVGAGDAACAALVVGLVAGWTPARIVTVANLCGACVAHQSGATEPLSPALLETVFMP